MGCELISDWRLVISYQDLAIGDQRLVIWGVWAIGGRGEGRKRKADDGFAAWRDFQFAATLRLAVLGFWAVYGDDGFRLLIRY